MERRRASGRGGRAVSGGGEGCSAGARWGRAADVRSPAVWPPAIGPAVVPGGAACRCRPCLMHCGCCSAEVHTVAPEGFGCGDRNTHSGFWTALGPMAPQLSCAREQLIPHSSMDAKMWNL